MSTIDVIPTTSSWTGASFTKVPAQSTLNELEYNMSDEEMMYLALFLCSIGMLVLSFVLKRKS